MEIQRETFITLTISEKLGHGKLHAFHDKIHRPIKWSKSVLTLGFYYLHIVKQVTGNVSAIVGKIWGGGGIFDLNFSCEEQRKSVSLTQTIFLGKI